MANKVRCIQLGNIAVGKSWDNPQSGRIYSVDGIAPTLNTCGGGQFGTKDIRNQGKERRYCRPGLRGQAIFSPLPRERTQTKGECMIPAAQLRRLRVGGGTVPCIITETEAKTWLKESLLQAEGETQAIHQTEPQAHQRNNGQSQTQRGCAIHLLPSKKTTMFWR